MTRRPQCVGSGLPAVLSPMTIKASGPILLGGAAVLAALLATLLSGPSGSPDPDGETDQTSAGEGRAAQVSGAGAIGAKQDKQPESLAARPIRQAASSRTLRARVGSAGPAREGAAESDVPDPAQWDLDIAEKALPPEDVDAFSPDAPLEDLLWWYAHPDERFQVAALEAIATHGDAGQARDVLSGALQDPRPAIRHLALTQLAELAPNWPDAALMVLTSLDDGDPSVRALASVLYGELEAAGVVPQR